MKIPKLPYYYYLPLALITLFLTLSLVSTMSVGIGSWNMNRTVNWGFGWFPGLDWTTRIFINLLIGSLPAITVAIYFLRKFFKRREMHLVNALLFGFLGFLLSF